jgi:hypothetical protein
LSLLLIIFQKDMDAHQQTCTNSDQMLPIDINGVDKTANKKVLSQNKCIMAQDVDVIF